MGIVQRNDESFVLYNTEFLSETAHAWMRDHGISMPDGFSCKKGDIVICSVYRNWSDPCDLGKVLQVVQPPGQKLPAGHRDGEYANVFVLTYKKQKLAGRKRLKGVNACLLHA